MEYTSEEDIYIDGLYEDMIAHSGLDPETEAEKLQLVHKAFMFAKEAHKGVRRRSGEPYITHPIAVAKIVSSEIKLGYKSIMASLLHDVVEDTDYTVADIEHLFGDKIAVMVDGLTKIAGVVGRETSQQAENFRKIILTLSDDVRVIIIKLADRLHNMRTLDSMPPNKQIKIAGETIYLFAPLAHRLGLYAIKTELEDLSLKILFPKEYKEISEKIAESSGKRNEFIDKFNNPIIEKLKENDIDFEVSARVKSVYSIWEKMQRKQIPFEEVYDIFAIRIVFKPSPLIPEKSQCWHIYSLITDIYKPKPDRIRDWVNIPKANGYEALHCTVMGPDGVWAEVQIRSERMNEIAERGFAAHWRYKEDKLNKDTSALDEWIEQVKQALNSPSSDDAFEFLDHFRLSLYDSDIVIFTPKGDQRHMPKGATALDFAYEIHSKIGNSAIGAKINHKIESIFTPIKSGDQIEIVTSHLAKPTAEWLEHVVTTKAKQSIKNFLKKDNQNSIEEGIAIFDEKLKQFGIPSSSRVLRKVIPAYQCAGKDEFYSKVGAGIITLDNLEKILRQNTAKKWMKFWGLQLSSILGSDGKKNGKSIKQPTPDQYEIASCCNPIPGDEIVAFKEDSGKVRIHKKKCSEAVKLAAQHGDTIVPARWSTQKAMSYLSHIEIRGIDRVGILLDLSHIITAELNVNIRKLYVESHDGIFEGYISVYVRNIKDLQRIIYKVSKIKGMDKVHRVESVN